MNRQDVAYAFGIRLKETIQVLRYSANNEEPASLTEANKKIKFLLADFNLLIKAIVDEEDTDSLIVVLNELRLFSESYDLTETIREYEFNEKLDDSRLFNRETKPLSTELYGHNRELLDWCNAVIFGNYSFLVYKKFYSEGQFAVNEKILSILEQSLRIDAKFVNFVQSFDNGGRNSLNWEDWIWGIEKRLNGQVYTLPSIFDIVTFGLTVYLLRNPNFKLQLNEKAFPHDYYFSRSEEFLAILRNQLHQWDSNLPIDWDSRIQTITDYYKTIKDKKEQLFYDTLSKTPLSPTRINDFILNMSEQWKKSQNLTKVFEFFKAIEVNPAFELQRIGKVINFQKAKRMFVDTEQYTHIYNIELGNEISRNKEELLGRRLLEVEIAEMDNSDFVNKLNDILSSSYKGEASPNVIFITTHEIYKYEEKLINSGKYLPAWQSKEQIYPFSYIGTYGNIPLIRIFSQLYSHRLILMNLPGSIMLYQREKTEWIDNRLKISVTEIEDEKAAEIYAKTSEYSNIPVDDALNVIKSGIIIDIDEVCDFKVISKDSIKVIRLG